MCSISDGWSWGAAVISAGCGEWHPEQVGRREFLGNGRKADSIGFPPDGAKVGAEAPHGSDPAMDSHRHVGISTSVDVIERDFRHSRASSEPQACFRRNEADGRRTWLHQMKLVDINIRTSANGHKVFFIG